MRVIPLCLTLALSAAAASVGAQPDRERLLAHIDDQAPRYGELARDIWEHAELGYLETESSALLQQTLEQAGFSVEQGIAEIPTAFMASYGSGEPVIGILAEFDALPGISQTDAPFRELREDVNAGHACGHHLFGAGSVAAAIAVREWMESEGISGTLRLYGTPAEEGGSGKVYMARAGLFDDTDAVLDWHPSDKNQANPSSSLANKSAKFRFSGQSSHAAAAPERGRSALDGVEAMNFMVNLMREHVPDSTRIHYVITSGGAAPNVVPDFAEVFYYVRHPDRGQLAGIWDRVVAAAEAAALGTGTEMKFEVIHGNYNRLPNETLARVMHRNLTAVGGVEYNDEERAFAKQISATLGDSARPLESASEIQPFAFSPGQGSTDVGDLSWLTPNTNMRAATWVPGTSAHSWQAIAAGGTSIGNKGMIVAAKTLALTAADLFTQPETLAAARAELEERRGEDFDYVPLLGDREPPLDYRVQR